jgi:hypothetical protein
LTHNCFGWDAKDRGLTGMRERAEGIGFQSHVWSNTGGGTEIDLSIPGHLAYQYQPSGPDAEGSAGCEIMNLYLERVM